MASRRNRAVVIGASISGLVAARALANHFKEVIVIERDLMPSASEARKGVPQGRHVHALLSQGREVLERFFPGFTQELAAQGAFTGDLSETVLWYSEGKYTHNFHSGLVAVEASRPLMEGTIFRRVCSLPNVTILENHDAAGLMTAPVGSGPDVRITGVRVMDRSQAVPVEKPVEADMVVDAGGRGSRCLGWLENLGYARPEEEHIKMNLSYTTRVFRRLPEHAGGHHPLIMVPSAPNRVGGAAFSIEGGFWIVTISGMLGETSPTDLAGFIAYSRKMETQDIYNVIKSAEPVGEAVQYRYPASQRRHFEKLTRFPEDLLVMGDAVCSFNPIYGQGMTVAASEAALLDDCLSEGLEGDTLRRAFYNRASRLLDAPWNISAGSDLAYPEVEGKRDPSMRLVRAYLKSLLNVSHNDPTVNIAFQRVTNLMDPPTSLFRPAIVWRVAKGSMRK